MPKINTTTEDVKPTPLKANIYYNVFEKQEERDFLRRLHDFMSQRAYPFPKLVWMGLRDGELFEIKLFFKGFFLIQTIFSYFSESFRYLQSHTEIWWI